MSSCPSSIILRCFLQLVHSTISITLWNVQCYWHANWLFLNKLSTVISTSNPEHTFTAKWIPCLLKKLPVNCNSFVCYLWNLKSLPFRNRRLLEHGHRTSFHVDVVIIFLKNPKNIAIPTNYLSVCIIINWPQGQNSPSVNYRNIRPVGIPDSIIIPELNHD